MSDLEQKTIELLDKFDKLATQYTPDAINAAISAVQVSAIGSLIWGVIGCFCAYGFWWIATHFTQYSRNKKQEDGYMSDWEFGIAIGYIGGGIVTGFIALFAVSELFEIWNWVAIFNPKLALAHKILGF